MKIIVCIFVCISSGNIIVWGIQNNLSKRSQYTPFWEKRSFLGYISFHWNLETEEQLIYCHTYSTFEFSSPLPPTLRYSACEIIFFVSVIWRKLKLVRAQKMKRKSVFEIYLISRSVGNRRAANPLWISHFLPPLGTTYVKSCFCVSMTWEGVKVECFQAYKSTKKLHQNIESGVLKTP